MRASQRSKHYEDRVDRAFLYPARQLELWQCNFTGVVRLSATGIRYWVNLWTTDTYRLRLSEKNGQLKTPVCRLSPLGSGHYTGELLLVHADAPRPFLLRVDLRATDQRWLEVRFNAVARRAQP